MTAAKTVPGEVRYISHILIGRLNESGILMVQTMEGEQPLARVLAEIKAARGLVEHMGITFESAGIAPALMSCTFVMVPDNVMAARYLAKQQPQQETTQDGKTTQG